MAPSHAAAALASPFVESPEEERGWWRKEAGTMWAMGWPMLVSFFSRMAMASVDSAFVGHITDGHHSAGTYLAAAGLSDMVTSLLIIPPLAFNQSLNALVSQAMGSGNKKMAGTWLQLSIFWLTVSYAPVLVSFFYVSQMLSALGFSPELCALAGSYARFNVFWPIPNGWYQCMRFYFQAQGITRPAMYNNLIFLAVNVLLNWVFVFGGPFRSWFGWNGFGFVGAAVSLSISRSSQPLAYWLYMFVWRKAHLETWPGWSMKFLKATYQKAFLSMALPQIGTLILQATIGQSTTLLIAQLGGIAVAASAATTAATQVFTGGLQPTLTAVGGIRVGYYLGKGEPKKAARAGWLAMLFGAGATCIVAAVLLPLAHPVMRVITSDVDVQEISSWLLPAVMVSIFAGVAVEVGTGGVLTSQGRPKMVTFLSMGFELPLSLGSIAILVLVFHAKLMEVYWAQAAVTMVEAVIVWAIIVKSDWRKHSAEAMARQAADVGSQAGSPAPSAGRTANAFERASPSMPVDLEVHTPPPMEMSPQMRGA